MRQARASCCCESRWGQEINSCVRTEVFWQRSGRGWVLGVGSDVVSTETFWDGWHAGFIASRYGVEKGNRMGLNKAARIRAASSSLLLFRHRIRKMRQPSLQRSKPRQKRRSWALQAHAQTFVKTLCLQTPLLEDITSVDIKSQFGACHADTESLQKHFEAGIRISFQLRPQVADKNGPGGGRHFCSMREYPPV